MAATFGTLLGEINGSASATSTASPQFISVGSGGGLGGLGNNPISVNVPVVSGGSPGGTTTPTSSGGLSGITSCSSFTLWNPFCWGQIGSQAAACVGDALLRFGLFLLGLILIIGAIYLYKGGGKTSIIAIPAKMAKGAVKATASAFKDVAGDAE